jgi:nucleoside-diphosphate-sugar epimerase
MNQVLDLVAQMCGELHLVHRRPARGDVRHTAADTAVATSSFGYCPRTTLQQGLAAMVAWSRAELSEPAVLPVQAQPVDVAERVELVG